MRDKRTVAGTALMVFALLMGGSAYAQRPSLRDILQRLEAIENKVAIIQDEIGPPVEVVVPAYAVGTYSDSGSNFQDVFPVGRTLDLGVFRNYFVFDLSTVHRAFGCDSDPEVCVFLISEAEFYVFNPADGFRTDSGDTETYVVNRVGTPFGGVGDPVVLELIRGADSVDIYTDLADGPGYGQYVASRFHNGSTLVFALESERALHDLNRRVNGETDGLAFPDPDSRLFAVGGHLSSLNDSPGEQLLFFGSDAAFAVSLVLAVKLEEMR